MTTLTITPIHCLVDNYCYLVACPGTGEAILVDPSESAPPLAALEANPHLKLVGIVSTHHHWDHTGGNEGVAVPWGGTGEPDEPGKVWIAAHASDRGRVPGQTVFVDAPSNRWIDSGVQVGGVELMARHIPGHTTGAIAWRIPAERAAPGEPDHVFTGDTLFAAGCGRLFEGTPAQMFQSLQALTELPGETRLWFGHEYTAANLRFAAVAEPFNEDVAQRIRDVASHGSTGTTPTTAALERATNPFVRAETIEALAERRAAKDEFQG